MFRIPYYFSIVGCSKVVAISTRNTRNDRRDIIKDITIETALKDGLLETSYNSLMLVLGT